MKISPDTKIIPATFFEKKHKPYEQKFTILNVKAWENSMTQCFYENIQKNCEEGGCVAHDGCDTCATAMG